MKIYLQALDYEIYEVICNGLFMPMTKKEVEDDISKPSSQWSELEKKNISLNSLRLVDTLDNMNYSKWNKMKVFIPCIMDLWIL